MPPRYAYWTIIVDDQPTAFRAGALDDIMPTFNRLKEKQPTAKLMWFQSGKLWPSRIDAREAMQVRGERGRHSDPRQDAGDKTPSRERPKWKSKDFSTGPRSPKPSDEHRVKPEWKPKDSSSPPAPGPQRGSRAGVEALKSSSPERRPKAAWQPKTPVEKPAWKPRGASSDRPVWKSKSTSSDRPAWKPKGASDERPDWQPKSGDRPAWKPRGAPRSEAPQPSSPGDPPKRKWIPKAEYKRLTGTEAKRDDKWRPGGEHQDPRQKYKDAKKAKWGRFKQAIRSRAKKKS